MQVKQCFWDLASVDLHTRRKAAETLSLALSQDANGNNKERSSSRASKTSLSQLDVKAGEEVVGGENVLQNGHEESVSKADEDFSMNCNLNRQTKERMDPLSKILAGREEEGSNLSRYAWKRLVQGMASSRAAARQGFALAMCLLLEDPCCPLSDGDVMKLLQEYLPANGKGREVRDALLGRLFGVGALVRAGRLSKTEDALTACSIVVNAAERKQFLQEAAAAIIVEIVDGCAGNLFEQESPLYHWMVEAKPEDSRAPDALYALLACWEDLPHKALEAAILLPSLDGVVPRHESSKSKGSKRRRDASDDKDLDVRRATGFLTSSHLQKVAPALAQTSNAHPRIHRAWFYLLGMLINGTCTPHDTETPPESRYMEHLQVFWTDAVEIPLLEGASHERKFLAMELFEILLPWVQANQVSILFSETFMRNLKAHLKNKNSLLHKKALATEATIDAFLSNGATREVSAAVAEVLRSLEKPKSNTHNDGPDSSGQSRDDAVSAHVLDKKLEELFRIFASPEKEDGSEGKQNRSDTLEKICSMAKASGSDGGICCNILRFLAAVAFLEVPEASPKLNKVKELILLSNMSDRLGTSIRNTATARLSKYAGLFSEQKKGLLVEGKKVDGLRIALDFIQSSLKKGAELASGDGKAISVAAKKLRKASEYADKVLKSNKCIFTKANVSAVKHFLMVHELQLYVDPYSGCIELVDDVCMALADAWKSGPPMWETLLPSMQTDPADKATPYWMDVLLDVISVFLTRSSSLVCEAASSLFRVFAEHLSHHGMTDLLEHLSGKSQDEEEDSESDPDSELGYSTEDDSEEEEEEDPEQEKRPTSMDLDVQQDDLSEEDDDVVFTDEQMFEMDKHLVDAFHSARERITEGKQAAEQVASFKLKIVGLLDAYVKKVPFSPLLPLAIIPLLNVMQLPTTTAGLKDSISSLLKEKICRSRAESSGTKLDLDVLEAILKETLERASRSSSKETSTASERCTRYILRACLGTNRKEGSRKLSESTKILVKEAILEHFHKKRCRLTLGFMLDAFETFPELGLFMLPGLIEIHPNLNEHDLIECIRLVHCAMRFGEPSELKEILNSTSVGLESLVTTTMEKKWNKSSRGNEARKWIREISRKFHGMVSD